MCSCQILCIDWKSNRNLYLRFVTNVDGRVKGTELCQMVGLLSANSNVQNGLPRHIKLFSISSFKVKVSAIVFIYSWLKECYEFKNPGYIYLYIIFIQGNIKNRKQSAPRLWSPSVNYVLCALLSRTKILFMLVPSWNHYWERGGLGVPF